MWSPTSWHERAAGQQPSWPDAGALERSLKQISSMPPLVFAGEARSLQTELGRVAAGNAFLLQAGDCAESFDDFSADTIREKLRVILQMAIILTYSVGVPIVKVGRIAGQFAKPRSSDMEQIGDIEIPSFRGHIVNDPTASEAARIPNPERLVQAYHQSASTLNLLRAFTKGGFADLSRVHAWTQEFVSSSPEGQRYEQLAGEIDRALGFMRACGIETESNSNLSEVDVLTSHEALILGYEEALTRQDSLTGAWFDCSAHMLWIGERTRELDGAHIEFLRGVGNPLGCKIGPTTSAEYLLELCEVLNPNRIPGRLTLISRMGADHVEDRLRPLLRRSPTPDTLSCGPATRCTATRSPPAPGARPATSTTSSVRSAGSCGPTAPRAPGPAASTSSSPARTSPNAWAVVTPCTTPTSTPATKRCATHGSTHARASTSRSGSPNCSATSPDPPAATR